MATSIVSTRGTVRGADFFVACFTWFEGETPFCQVDYGLSLAQLLDRAEAWIASGRGFPGVEVWLGTRQCVLVLGDSGCEPEAGGMGFPRERGVYRWDDETDAFVSLTRRARRALLA